MFQGTELVLRGKWVDYNALLRARQMRTDPSKFNHFMQVNAASILGFDAFRIFASAHVVHPMRRSVMVQLFDDHRDEFVNNIHHRFRDLSQFLRQGLHNHACIKSGDVVIQTADDHVHVRSGQGLGDSPDELRDFLRRAVRAEIKFLCVNDLPQLETIIPEACNWIDSAIGVVPKSA